MFAIQNFLLRSYINNLCFVFHQRFQTLESIKTLSLRPLVFISFAVFGTSDEILTLIVDILRTKHVFQHDFCGLSIVSHDKQVILPSPLLAGNDIVTFFAFLVEEQKNQDFAWLYICYWPLSWLWLRAPLLVTHSGCQQNKNSRHSKQHLQLTHKGGWQ